MGVGAERPKTWGGSSQKLGRIDRLWGGSTRGGSTRYPKYYIGQNTTSATLTAAAIEIELLLL